MQEDRRRRGHRALRRMEDFLTVPWCHPGIPPRFPEMNEVPDPRDWERSRVIVWSVGLTRWGRAGRCTRRDGREQAEAEVAEVTFIVKAAKT